MISGGAWQASDVDSSIAQLPSSGVSDGVAAAWAWRGWKKTIQ